MVERLLLQLYQLLLRLYPREFQQDFAAEMQTVFGDALRAARLDGLWAMLRLCSREARELPRALAREYWQLEREKEAGMDTNMRFAAGPEGAESTGGRHLPVHGWGDVLLASLPFGLFLLLDVLPKALVEAGLLNWETPALQRVNIFLRLILVGGGFLLVLFLLWRRKWPAGLATWYLFFGLAPVMLAGALVSSVLGKNWNFVLNQDMMITVGIPLLLAVLLYAVTRRDPLRGLLAALPMLYFLWETNMESVPDLIEVAIKVPSLVLICLAIAFLLRQGEWRTGLYAVLGMNLVVGALFAYAGIYYGGTLPYVASGPNLVEVARSLIPQYLATGAILLGPLFALKFRQAGRSGDRAGRAGYHLALAGLLLVILANLTSLELSTSSGSPGIASSNRNLLTAAILLGLGLYLLGVFFVYREARFKPGTAGGMERLLLAVLPLAIPVIFMLPFITWKWPVSDLYGIPLLWKLPQAVSLAIGLVWLGLSVWVVTRRAEPSGPSASVRRAPEAALLS